MPDRSRKSIEELSHLPLLPKYSLKKNAFSRSFYGIMSFGFMGALLVFSLYYLFVPTHSLKFANLRSPLPNFIGRKLYLEALEREFEFKKKNEVAFSMVKQIWGMSGFGKSELAIEFANKHIHEFSFIWTFHCETQDQLDQGYNQLAEKLGISRQKEESVEELKRKVHVFLENYSSYWLLIYNDVQIPLKEIPQRGGIVLVTSQVKVLDPTFIMEIGPLSKEESIEVLKKITGEGSSREMELLAEDLGGIPLLVNQSAHYIKMTPGCTVAEYQKLFLNEVERSVSKQTQEHLRRLSASWEFTSKALEKECPLALNWLFVSSYLYAEHVFEDWIDIWVPKSKKEVLKILQDYGIIRYEKDTKTFSVNRLLQTIIREVRKGNFEEDLEKAISFLIKVLKAYDQDSVHSLNQEMWIYSHVYELIKWTTFSRIPNLPYLTLLYEEIAKLGIITYDCYLESLETNFKALTLKEPSLHSNPIEHGIAHANLGEVYYKLGRYFEALGSSNQAETLLNPHFSERPLAVALNLNIKGLILWELGELEKSLEVHKRALEIFQKYILTNRSLLGFSINNTALCLRDLGRYEEAMEYVNKALEIYQKYCPNHPWHIWALQNKAWVFYHQNKIKEALDCFNQALALDEKIRHNNPGLAYSWNGIGWCYIVLSNFSMAKECFEKALKLGELRLSPRILIRAYKGLGWAYIHAKEFDKGLEALYTHLKKTFENYRNSPKMLAALKDFQKACEMAKIAKVEIKPLAQKAYEISNITLGSDHPITSYFSSFL